MADRVAEARRLARAGRTAAAEQRLRLALAEEPTDVEAWLWLAALQTDVAARRAALEQVLALEPGNQSAHRALAELPADADAPRLPVSLPTPPAPHPAAVVAPTPLPPLPAAPTVLPPLVAAPMRPAVTVAAARPRRTRRQPGHEMRGTVVAMAIFASALLAGHLFGDRVLTPATTPTTQVVAQKLPTP